MIDVEKRSPYQGNSTYLESERLCVVWTRHEICVDTGSATEVPCVGHLLFQPQTVSVAWALRATGDATWAKGKQMKHFNTHNSKDTLHTHFNTQ